MRGLPLGSNAKALLPVLIAGLPASSACVSVGPPLFARAPSNGFVTPTWFPLTPLLKAPPVPTKLKELESFTVPLISSGVPERVLPATIVLRSVTSRLTNSMPPPAETELLLVIVTFWSVLVPPLLDKPPLPPGKGNVARFPEMVLFTTKSVVAAPLTLIPPPENAELFANKEFLMVVAPPDAETAPPPPNAGELFVMDTPLIVATPPLTRMAVAELPTTAPPFIDNAPLSDEIAEIPRFGWPVEVPPKLQLFRTNEGPSLKMPAPKLSTTLPKILQLASVKLPLLLTPPPKLVPVRLPFEIVTPEMLTVRPAPIEKIRKLGVPLAELR